MKDSFFINVTTSSYLEVASILKITPELKENSNEFLSINASEVSFKMGLDVKKKEVIIDAKNWKEIFLICIILVFFLVIFFLIAILMIKYRKFFSKKRPFGWSYRSNYDLWQFNSLNV